MATFAEGRFAGDRLYYRSWQPDVPPRGQVVLSHGFAEHSGRYEHVAAALLDSELSVWAPDHRGHGRSEGARARHRVGVGRRGRPRPVRRSGPGPGAGRAAVPRRPLHGRPDRHRLRRARTRTGSPAWPCRAPCSTWRPRWWRSPTSRRSPTWGWPTPSPAIRPSCRPTKTIPWSTWVLRPADSCGPPVRSTRSGPALAELSLPLLVMHGSADLLVSPQALKDVVMRRGQPGPHGPAVARALARDLQRAPASRGPGHAPRWISERID